MFDQVITEGATDPISIRWAIDNPFDATEEKEQAGRKNLRERAKVDPEKLVPQMANKTINRRELK